MSSIPVSKTASGISIPLTGLAKQAQPGNTRGMEPLYIAEFKQNPLLCPVRCLREYVTCTQAWIDTQSHLFLALMAPHKPVVSSSIAQWLKYVLHQSGVDISCFAAHSTRGASASTAALSGLTTAMIMQRAGWSQRNTFSVFYHRPTANSASHGI